MYEVIDHVHVICIQYVCTVLLTYVIDEFDAFVNGGFHLFR